MISNFTQSITFLSFLNSKCISKLEKKHEHPCCQTSRNAGAPSSEFQVDSTVDFTSALVFSLFSLSLKASLVLTLEAASTSIVFEFYDFEFLSLVA